MAADFITITPTAFQLTPPPGPGLALPQPAKEAARTLGYSVEAPPLLPKPVEGAARQLLDRFQAALAGYLQLPAWTMPTTPAAEPLIQQALESGHDIEIRYWGPADGQVTTRTVTPYWIEERHQSRYLMGWYHLRQRGKNAVQKLTTGEVARRLGLSVSTIRNLIAQGELKAERRNTTSQYRILSTELECYAREHGLTLLTDVETDKSKG